MTYAKSAVRRMNVCILAYVVICCVGLLTSGCESEKRNMMDPTQPDKKLADGTLVKYVHKLYDYTYSLTEWTTRLRDEINNSPFYEYLYAELGRDEAVVYYRLRAVPEAVSAATTHAANQLSPKELKGGTLEIHAVYRLPFDGLSPTSDYQVLSDWLRKYVADSLSVDASSIKYSMDTEDVLVGPGDVQHMVRFTLQAQKDITEALKQREFIAATTERKTSE